MESEEPMDVDAGADYDKFDDLLEEGEYEEEESNRVSRKVISSVIASKDPPPSEYKNKGGSFITGVDIFSKESKEKLQERAKRFNIAKGKDNFAVDEAENLYESFGMNDDNIRDYRLNVIHMRGTGDMSTEEVFDYFKKYAPDSLEWINDVSCNVVWLDNPSAARAMLGLSKKITGIKKDPRRKHLDTSGCYSNDEAEDDSDDDLIIVNGKDPRDENSVNMKDIRCPLPPGIWRKGNNYKESRNIFLRFATRTDKKGYHAERMSEYYKKHGNPNYGGVKGILTTSRKRSFKQTKETSPSSHRESSLNGIAAKNPWGTLSKNWGRTDFVEREYVPKVPPNSSSNIKKRLGYRRDEDDDDEDDDDSDVEEVIELSDDSGSRGSSDEWSKRSKMPRMRMHADDEEQNIEKRKGKIRKLTEKIVASDLRGRLTARRRLPPVDTEAIQVVVTNPKAIIKSDFSNIDVTEDEEDEEDDDDVQIVGSQDDEDEEEEGEILEESESDGKVEYEDDDDDDEQEQEEEEEEEEEEDEEEEEEDEEEERPVVQFEDESSDSSLSEKEVRGPKGSVIKVVQHKPKLASTVTTVWSRLNHSKNEREKSPESQYPKRDLRHALKKTDLRSRIGNHHTRGRSPLRIELRNDKYSARQDSDSD